MMPAPADLRARQGARGRLAEAVDALRAQPWRPVLLSFLAARVVVGLALVVAELLRAQDPDLREDDLLGWDAAWYHRIAEQGYADLDREGVRFFPLLPLMARVLGLVVGDAGIALLLLSNGLAIVFALLLHRLALREGLGREVADRAVWVAAFVPAGFVHVMGYTETTYGVLVCGLLLAARERRWVVVLALGVLVGLLRPPGVVLAPVVLVEALRGLGGGGLAGLLAGLRALGPRELALRALAVAGPVLGFASYLLWSGLVLGDPLLPLQEQTHPGRRGGTFINPLVLTLKTLRGLPQGEVTGASVHLLWAGVALALLVVVVKRLPLSHAVLTGLTLVLALTARNMSSFERYAASAAPLLLAVALVLSTSRRRRAALVVAPPVLLSYSVVAFLHLYVP